MVTLLVGLSVVAVSAAGFWLVLFGHNPATRPATQPPIQGEFPAAAENSPRASTPATTPIVSRKRRIRSALILILATVGTAALVGAILSVIVVVAVLIVT